MTSRETDRTTRPFQVIADSELQLDNPFHAKIFDRLLSDVRNGEPLAVLTGEPGTGKTTILRRLITQLEWRGFRSVIQRVPVGLDDLEAILSTIAPERPLVVGLDEAQALSDELLASLPALLAQSPGVGIVLVGEPALIERMEALEGQGVRFPISAKCRLAPLDAGEVAAYIDYCWHQASAEPCPFTAAAIRRIAGVSRGIPQVVNSICDRALHLAEARGLTAISAELADEAAQDLILDRSRGIFGWLKPRFSALPLMSRTAFATSGAVAVLLLLLIVGSAGLFPSPAVRGRETWLAMVPAFLRQRAPVERASMVPLATGPDTLVMARPDDAALAPSNPAAQGQHGGSGSAPPKPLATLPDAPATSAATQLEASRVAPPKPLAMVPPDAPAKSTAVAPPDTPAVAAPKPVAPVMPDRRAKSSTAPAHQTAGPAPPALRALVPPDAPPKAARAARRQPVVAMAPVPKRERLARPPSAAARSASSMADAVPDSSHGRRAAMSVAANRLSSGANAALLQYAEDGDVQATRALLANKVDPDPRDAGGLTPLMLAVIHDHAAIADVLIARGAFVNSQSRAGLSPLMFAAINNRLTAIGTLLKSGANPNVKTRAGWTALTYAAWHGHPAIVRVLLKHGADVRVIDRTGWTILDYASWRVLQPAAASDLSALVTGVAVTPTMASDADHAAVVGLLQRAGARREHTPSS